MSRWAVTGCAGHLGEALVRVLRDRGEDVVGLDRLASPTTTSRLDLGRPEARTALVDLLSGVDHVLHTATLHKPHIGTHTRAQFVETNVAGTLTLLDAARAADVASVVFTSTTSAFGRALTPERGAPAAWITEDVGHRVRNVYGATKTAAEDLAELAARDGLPVVVLRTSRFFPEHDDRDDVRIAWVDANLKAVEFLHRRVDLADVVEAHLLAARRAPEIGFGRYVVSATTPFSRDDGPALASDARDVVRSRFPDIADRFAARGWQLPRRIDRVYDNERARIELGWEPVYDFVAASELALTDGDPRSLLARAVGAKGYHPVTSGVYTP